MINPQQTKKVNIEMVIGQLEQERNKKASEFSKEIKEWGQKIAEKEDAYDKVCKKTEKEEKRLEKQQDTFLKSKEVCYGKIHTLNQVFNKTKLSKIKVVREIDSVNKRIIQSEDYFSKLEVKKKELEGKVSDLEDLALIRDELEANIELLRTKNNELMGNRGRLRQQISAISKTLQGQITEAHEKMVLYENRATKAENKMHSFVDEYIRKMRDLEIIKKRVEAVYEGVFPGGVINLK